jgi:hypothetical protein
MVTRGEVALIQIKGCLSAFVIVCGLSVLIRQPVPQRIIEFVQSRSLPSGTIERSDFVAFNRFAVCFTHPERSALS